MGQKKFLLLYFVVLFNPGNNCSGFSGVPERTWRTRGRREEEEKEKEEERGRGE
jgi:hypothetical protein